MRAGCSGCLGAVIALALTTLLVGGTVVATVRMLAEPEVSEPRTTAADGSRAQRKIFELGRQTRRAETIILTQAEVNALLVRHVVDARGVRLGSPSVELIGGNRFVVHAQSPLRQLLDEAGLGAMASVLPTGWQARPVWLRVGARVRVKSDAPRQLRVDVDEFAIGRQRLPAPALRLLLDPAAVALLQWTLPDHVESVAIEPDRVVIQTAAPR